MFKLIGSLIKTALFIIAVLVLGNWIRWDGRTLSEHVRGRTAWMEKSNAVKSARDWTEKVTSDAREGYLRKIPNPFAGKAASAPATKPSASSPARSASRDQLTAQPQEEVPASERQKLRALIEELNTSSSAPARR